GVNLAVDSSLQDGGVDEGGLGMRMAGRETARAVFDQHTLDALAGDVRQLVLVDEGHLGVLRRRRRLGNRAAERQYGNQQRTEDALHGALLWSAHADQAAARERRNHSSRPMRPSRASPSGTSERSSTKLPKYRASASRTTSRGSPTAFR